MISQTSEYALRAVVHLARQGEGPCTAKEIAEATKVPQGYLSKILQGLAKANLLDAQRGLHGGFVLSRSPDEITMLDVLNATDAPISRITSCPLGIGGHTTLCELHKRLDDAIAEVEKRFKSTSIGDILRSTRRSKALCEEGGGGKASLSISASKSRR